jgi:cytochrome c oxidase cbb3-type subunit 3
MDQDHTKIEIDAHSGTPTTGHEWDGIRELNTPLPRWWLWTFYATIIWSFFYWVLYPAWPLIGGGHTPGVLGWNSRQAVVEDLAGLRQVRAGNVERISKASLTDIKADPELLTFAKNQGKAAFATNCAPCHGAGGQGSKGYPNLNADRWIWGGTLDAIHQTVSHGIRWEADPQTRTSTMPAFGREGLLKKDEISAVADYVLSIAGYKVEDKSGLAKGQEVYQNNCAACHGDDGKGNLEIGAPNLTTKVWLYGGKDGIDKVAIEERINVGGGGVMPAWSDRLDESTIKSLAVYVHSLGGGK